ncbi:MAG: hypothetical protein J6V71_00905 [Clostridia bacterium]|nr:hypothetical protein [Clostridia bacterium]
MNILSSFLVGFLSTSFLFVLSLIMVLGVKYLHLIIKDLLAQDTPPEEMGKKPSPARKRKKHKPKHDKRSIEIDPSEIDKIFVKKSS